jgi:amidase
LSNRRLPAERILQAKPYRLTADEVVYAIDAKVKPRLTLAAPAEVIIDTLDSRGGRLQRHEDVEATAPDYRDRFPRTNPATGPIAVMDAEPGDVLTAEILGIDLDDHGYTLAKPGFGVIADMVERPLARLCRVVDNTIHFGDLRLPARPMIGVIATAPSGEPRGTAFVGSYGGNLDCNLVTTGSKIRLPVRVPGALFFIGDVHATMGDGEISGTGFEIGARIHVRLSLTKSRALDWPWLETETLIVTLGAAPTFEQASDIAIRAMLLRLVAAYQITKVEAYMLMSIRGDLRINQACRSPVDTSVRFEFPKLESLK